MARVASCPQCEHELLVPDNAEPSALVKCPECRAFFELQHAESRELPAALIVQSHAELGGASVTLSKSPTLDDFSSLATLKGDLEPISEEDLKGEVGRTAEFVAADEKSTAEYIPASPRASQLADETLEFKQPGTESHEEAAQRIDQWFRSAKTLSDMPPLEESDLAGQSSHEMLEPPMHPAGDAPIDSGIDDAAFAEVAPDLELETPSDAAPWDDSQHMDRLLADLEGQPIDSYEPEGHEVSASPHEEHEHFQPAGDWTPDESLSIPSAPGQPEPKRSVVRMLVGTAFGGIVGLGLAYYALLWMGPMLNRGKDIDFLQVTQYLPKAILPAAFQTDAKQPAALPSSKMVNDLAASEKDTKTEQATPADPVAPPAPADSTAQKPAAPAETQANFTTPVEPAKKSAATDNRYAIPAAPAAKTDPAMSEPAPLDAPPAKAITEAKPKAEPVRIANAPSFTAADVSTTLAAANAAEPGLVTGNLQDGKKSRTKGASYMAIAEFAEKATFADAADVAKSQQQSDEFFRKLLSSAHTRDEVAQIVPRWLSHPKRPHNGVFLAGNVKHIDTPGSVIEYTVELNGGPTVIVVVPVTDRSESIGGPKGPIAVAGSIIDKPASDIPGYKGNAPQVVFAKKLIPLE